MIMKKLYAMLLGLVITNAFAYDVVYTLSSDAGKEGKLTLTVENTRNQRVVINKLQVVNANGDICLYASDFILKPGTMAVFAPFDQAKCFGVSKDLVLDAAYKETDAMLPGQVGVDMKLKTQYTRGFQPDPYSKNWSYSLYFAKD